MRDCVIDLITISYVKNTGDIGQGTSTETIKQIYATVESVSQSEFYAASQHGLKPQYKFTAWQFEYDGQTLIEYEGKRYSVIRTFNRDADEKTELYCEARAGNG